MKRAVIVVLGVCLLIGSHLRAQSSYEPIHTFSGNKGRPTAGLVQGADGRLYGTTESGGFHGKGSVFATDASGNAEVLHQFSGADGETPLGRLLLASDQSLYGTTSAGGDGFGTVFRIAPDGTFSTMWRFDGHAGGAFPHSGLIEHDRLLYGTTINGGSGFGTVFTLSLDGVHTPIPFDGSNGAAPRGTLVFRATDQSFYGTTEAGGGADGNVFRLTADGVLEHVASFDLATTGAKPVDGLIDTAHGLYGTTPVGGAGGVGTLVSVDPDAGTLTAVHSFSDFDGSTPMGGLQQFADGMLYGTTQSGGGEFAGTAFRFSPDTGSLESLVSFSFFEGGKFPSGGIIETSDGVFGTTPNGGPGGLGTVFQVTLPNETLESAAAQSAILSFGGSDGSTPSGQLLQTTDGTFYGTTMFGGEFGLGTVFRLTPDGLITTIASFDGINGNTPSGGLVQVGNSLYGTTELGGFGDGNVFRIDLTTDALTEVTVFDSFDATGANPRGGLILASDGNLYGTTEFGPNFSQGSVFRLTPDGTLTTVVDFVDPNGLEEADDHGMFPTSGVVEADGYLYGVTEEGGAFGGGLLFRISLADDSLTPIKSFDGAADGSLPTARPLIASDGSLYGTTQFGGAAGQGVIYRFDLTAADPSAPEAFSAVASFDGSNGSMPFQEGLIEANGKLYGTTSAGGNGFGVLYQLDGGAIVPIHLLDGGVGAGPSSTLINSFDGALYGTTQGPQGGTIFRITFEDDAATLEVAPATATYGGVATLSATLSSSSGPVVGATIEFSLNGASVSAITDEGGVAAASVSVAGLNAGSYPAAITATSAAAPGVIATADLSIDKANPTVSVTGGTFVYDTEPHAASATVTGVAGEDLGAAAITYNGSADAPIDPRTYMVMATYAGNENYEGGSGTAELIILPPAPGVTGLIAAYGFNEGDGNIAADSSGHNHEGVIRGATYVPGRFGKALSFDGHRNWVTVNDHADLDIRNGLTIEAWVNPRELNGWNTVALKETSDSLAYALYANDAAPRAAGYVSISGDHKSVTSPGALPLNTWSHIAVTYSGTTLRFYVNGVEVNRKTLSGRIVAGKGALRIGGNSVWDDEFFDGLIDEVRIYGSAISQADIQRDMNMPIAYEFEPPLVSIASPLDGAVLSGTPLITATASDNVAVASVQFEVDGKLIAKSIADAPYTTNLNAANGDHVIRALARDTAGNTTMSEPITIRIANRRVADYRFNEPAGLGIVDNSGLGNHGMMSAFGVSRVSDAKRGQVLQFSGGGGMVSVPDADSLDLTTGITLEAWVKPSALSGWRTVVLKESGPDAEVYSIYANEDVLAPAGYLLIDSEYRAVHGNRRLVLGEWTHLAMTYDGAMMRFFVNGEEKESRAQTGSALMSSGQLSIGGNTIWGEYFRGQMDDVRIYDVAVGEAQIKADMNGAQ